MNNNEQIKDDALIPSSNERGLVSRSVALTKRGLELLKTLGRKKATDESRELQQQLITVSTQTLLTKGEFEVKNGEIEINEYTAEYFNRVWQELTNKDQHDFYGVFLRPFNVKELVGEINRHADEMEKFHYPARFVQKQRGMATVLRETAKQNKGSAIVYLFDEALPEARLHRDEWLSGLD